MVGLDLRQGGVRKVQVASARKGYVQVLAELRRRRLHFGEGHAEEEPVGVVEVHDPIRTTGNDERIRTALAEERIALRASHQAVVARAAREEVVARPTVYMTGLAAEDATLDYMRFLPSRREVWWDKPRSDIDCVYCGQSEHGRFARGDGQRLPVKHRRAA